MHIELFQIYFYSKKILRWRHAFGVMPLTNSNNSVTHLFLFRILVSTLNRGASGDSELGNVFISFRD